MGLTRWDPQRTELTECAPGSRQCLLRPLVFRGSGGASPRARRRLLRSSCRSQASDCWQYQFSSSEASNTPISSTPRGESSYLTEASTGSPAQHHTHEASL